MTLFDYHICLSATHSFLFARFNDVRFLLSFILSMFTFTHNVCLDSMAYDAYVNIPFGVAHYKGRLFVALPRRNPGIPSTLNVAVLNGDPPHLNPRLTGYPNYQVTSLDVGIANKFSYLSSNVLNH